MRTAVVGLVTMTVGCLLFVPASASGIVRHVPVRAVRARGRHHDRAGGRQSVDLDARQTANGAQPTDLCAGIQFAGHDDIPSVGSILILGSLRRSTRRPCPGRRSMRSAARRRASSNTPTSASPRPCWWSRPSSGCAAIPGRTAAGAEPHPADAFAAARTAAFRLRGARASSCTSAPRWPSAR